jgi:hypothetical protein
VTARVCSGAGLSYTTFKMTQITLPRLPDNVLSDSEVAFISSGPRPQGQLRGASHALATVEVTVTNTGRLAGDEVVFLFHNASHAAAEWSQRPDSEGPDPLAIKQLVGFERVRLEPNQSKLVRFPVSVRMLSTVDKHGVRHSLAGMHELILSRGHGEEIRHQLMLRLPPSASGRVVLGQGPNL